MIFAERILEDFIDRITGRNIDRLVGQYPDDTYFVGKLSTIDDVRNNRNINSDVSVNQMSMDFFITKDEIENSKLKIKIRGDFYYRVMPTFEEQRKYFIKEMNRKSTGRKFDSMAEIISFFEDNKNNRDILNLNRCPILNVFEKLSLDDSIILEIHLKDMLNPNKDMGMYSFKDQISGYLDRKIDEIISQADIYKAIQEDIKVEQLIDEHKYDNFLIQYSSHHVPRPNFELNLSVGVKLVKDSLFRVSVGLSNTTLKNEINTFKKNLSHDSILFNAGFDVKLINAKFDDIKLDYFLDDYKYDKTVKGIGHNCSLEFDNKNNVLKTTNIPKFYQKRLKTKDGLSVKFQDLISDPVKTLENISAEMEKEIEKWKKEYEKKKDNLIEDKSMLGKAQKDFQDEIKGFRFEIDRFKYGIEQIENREMVRKAFINMNKAFKMSSTSHDSWRLFQIVFIVSLVPDIILSHYGEDDIEKSFIDMVDLLYFPTGGGKTEAFLGCIVFTLFFDRIRGKSSGVSSLVKYPLRLLSVQQINRIANVLAAAEIIRRNNKEDYPGDSFSLGYYVGDNNTPNELNEEKIFNFSNKTQGQLNDELRIVDVCPFCKQKTVDIVLNIGSIKLKHVCRNNNCPSGGELPIHIVDREIYRYLPSVIVSTIDKIASMGFQSNFRNILGEVQHQCPAHGYTSKTRCTENQLCEKDVREFKEVSLFDPAPTLLIQDEVHLIRESLGTFNSHYETLMQYLISNLISNKKKLKIIGATATISSYEKHILNLYNKQPIRFPAKSPYIGEDFYSYTDDKDINRIIISYAPFGRAIINSVVYSLKYLRQAVEEYYKNIDKLKSIPGIQINSDDEAYEILKDYWIFLEYNNVKIDGNKVINALDNIISPQLLEEGYKKFEIQKMTGDETFQTVRQILSQVENNDNVLEGVNLIAATSMISHGVDANRFNTMMFFGMPNNTAEYIQAYSRVGRKYPGIVIDIIRPTRERDVSYLKYFDKFHKYKDILVEPVPINRWASKAVEKTLSGVVAAILMDSYDLKYQYEYGNLYNMKILKKLIEGEIIKKDELINHVKEAYGCQLNNGGSSNLSLNYSKFIDDSIDKIFKNIKDKYYGDGYYYLGNNTGLPMLDPRLNAPMTSLRYTDKSVNIGLR